ncbi:ribonucleoside-triphosphate reductase, adenosylcobalamin-dependent [Synechococcus sp. H60.1]|uniref:ribonucleoside-triphosphate reductase, adenosylcobalamin-dependent n=1 Tax=Synechococcus sp. H60.1 TaxID=2964517 RepID=UPI0039C344DE
MVSISSRSSEQSKAVPLLQGQALGSGGEFPATAPTAAPVFYRTYSRRRPDGSRETWSDVCDRTLADIARLGRFTPQERELVEHLQRQLKALISGRALWVMGTAWIQKPENYSGAYNCTSLTVVDWPSFGLMMDLAMMGCGTGAVLEPQFISQLPPILNRLQVQVVGSLGATPREQRQEHTRIQRQGSRVHIQVGDSRRGWVESYQALLELAADPSLGGEVQVTVDLSDVRPAGERLQGFGGVANPIKLPGLYERCAAILNKAVGRQLNSVECCLLIDEAAVTIVAGNIRRCLPENALVHTSQGLVPIKDVQVGDWVQTPLGFRRVVNKFDQGIQEVYEIETNALPFFSTLNHRHAVLADARGNIAWKSTHELVEGDRLLHNTQVLPGTITHLPEDFTAPRPSQSPTAKPLHIPPLTTEVAWLIGFTQGGGYVALGRDLHGKPYGHLEWSANTLDPELLSRLQAKLEQALAAFGLTATCSYGPGENRARFVCSCIPLAEYFERHIKKPKQPLQVPDFILRGTVEVRSAYLAGLIDSDGSTRSHPPQLLTTVHRSFALQVGAVLSSLGIAGRLQILPPQQENWQVQYSLTLPAFKARYNALVAPYSAKGKLPQGLETHGFTIPGSLLREVYSYTEMHGMGCQGARSVEANYERYLAESGLDLDIPVTVKGLGSHDWVRTYDIEVEEAHCFYCNGYLTHNSAGMRQFAADDELGSSAKDNLWQQDEQGNWRIDPERDALRMANHTRVFHRKPTREECIAAVRKQFYSGEGAIQWAGEAVARANADLLATPELKQTFLNIYASQGPEEARRWLKHHWPTLPEAELEHRLRRYGLNPCGEIIGCDFHCNLAEIHLNRLDPHNRQEQEEAFTAGALTAAALLHHRFVEPRFQRSREWDPIVGVSFTGLFDFCVKAFGVDWLRWWQEGRPDTPLGREFKQQEREYLSFWKEVVHRVVWDYCDRHGLRRPNRCTTVQPAGTKSLLTNASPGWHPPKAQRYIRRITFAKNDPVALACLDYGYSVVPAQADKDENGNLLNDPFDPRCTEWLVELPVEVEWANLPGAEEIEIERFSALAQFDFYMQVQKYYTTHNTSATIELREDEIEALGSRIYEAIRDDEGYISAALLARFDAPFPRLPFEKIDKATYERLMAEVKQRRKTDNFYEALARYDRNLALMAEGPAGCDALGCLMPEASPQSENPPR